MATKISTELLIMILNNNQSTQDLYSSLLVNRIWCKVAIPILWELTFGQECCMDDNKLRKKALCIRTYISCMNTQARTLLIQNGFDLSSSKPQATFDYPSFTHKFIINNLVNFVYIYSKQIITPDQDLYNNNKNEIFITEFTRSRILFHEMCKLIINRCTFLDSFKMTGVENFRDYGDLIGSIPKLPGAPKVFEKLESFTSTIDYGLIRPLFESLKSICDNILKMDLSLFSYPQAQVLAKLISTQKRLENLSLGANYYLNCNSLLWAIVSQKETLKSLRLYSVSFYPFEAKSSPIGQFISLQELSIENCHGLCKLDNLFLASSFTQLSSFQYFHSSYPYTKYPQEFIIKIFETANTKLRKIFLNSYTPDTFLAILNYCTKITKLTLYDLSFEQVIAIFNNNFNELRRLSFECGEEEFDADELLCRMAENVPKSLEIIKIIMGYDPWIFSASSLRKLFEGWCCKRRGGNKKIIVKRTDQSRLFTLSDEQFKVVEEYKVQFDIFDIED